MALFIAIVAVLSLPVLGKAFGWALFTAACDPSLAGTSLRIALPLALVGLGYLIFVLEGTQSSVMLANKQSAESLAHTLETIDTSKKRREQAKSALASSADHAPIDGFIIGRQILMVLLAFLFKIAYDAASLTLAELETLAKHAAACPVSASTTIVLYRVFDDWVFSTVLSALIVAYICQVIPKLMAQNHPMRFLMTMGLAVFWPRICQFLGRWSFLNVPIDQLRARAQARPDKLSYFSKQREFTPVDGRQFYESLVARQGESITEMTIDITKVDKGPIPKWFVSIGAQYEVIVAAREFSHVVFPVEANDLKGTVHAIVNASAPREGLVSSGAKSFFSPATSRETEACLKGRFDRVIPEGSQLIWRIGYFMPILSAGGASPFEQLVFELPLIKPVRTVRFFVEEKWSSDPDVHILPLLGLQAPQGGTITVDRDHKCRMVTVDYPPVPSRLRFTF